MPALLLSGHGVFAGETLLDHQLERKKVQLVQPANSSITKRGVPEGSYTRRPMTLDELKASEEEELDRVEEMVNRMLDSDGYKYNKYDSRK